MATKNPVFKPAKASAKAPAVAKPTPAPATPAAALPEGSLPAQEDAFKEVSVYQAGGAGQTTISIPVGEYEHMLSFAGESHEAVESACVAASRVLEPLKGDTWTETVAAGAMLALMEAYHSKRKAKPGRSTT